MRLRDVVWEAPASGGTVSPLSTQQPRGDRSCATPPCRFLADRQQAGAVVRAQDDPVAAPLAAQNFDLRFEEPDAGVPASGARFKVDA